ncbi:MAG: phenylalanine--tRNA ligase subunit beta [Campylobacterales bacterium]|nr:phenylalanine--tRNA ligase subunit beta [Campylobacterales bacterium]
MIITRNWLNEFLDISKISTDELCIALNSIGLEVDGTEKIKIANGVKVGYVESCAKHPDADKLNVCQVNLGDTNVQIVCGAKNVEAGQTVAVATVGTILGDDFKIKKAKLRGVESLGMICSSSEIGLPTTNDGILVLDDSIGELILGANLNTIKALDDEIIEIELTSNRGDCLSINGVARDLSAYFNIKMKPFNPSIEYTDTTLGQILSVSTQGEIDTRLTISSADFTSYTLPVLYSIRTAIASCYNSNSALTIAAYATHSTGVLFDLIAQKLEKDDYNLCKLNINKNDKGFDCLYSNNEITTLAINSNNVVLNNDDDTSNIQKVVIAALYTDPIQLATKVFDTKIKTDDIYYRSSRGSEYDLDFGTEYLQSILSKCGVKIHKSTKHISNDKQENAINAPIQKIYSIIGQEIETTEIVQILESLGFKVKVSHNELLSITVPLFRHDIINIADITEEIVRIIGIDNIKSKPLVIAEDNRINTTSNSLVKKNKIRQKAISNGFYEAISYVFSSKESLEKYNFPIVSTKKDITNPITKELNTFRTTLLVNMIDAVSNNYKYGYSKVALFENGVVFDKNRIESKKIAFVHSGLKEAEDISNQAKPKTIDLFTFANNVSNTIGKFELEPMRTLDNAFIHPYQNGHIIQNGKKIGYLSKLHPSVAKDFDIDDTFIAEIDFDAISDELVLATDISKYQSSKRDLSIIAPKDLKYKQIKKYINTLNINEIKQFNLIDIYSDEKLGDNESLTIQFVLQSNNKTMEEAEINSITERILTQLKDKLNIGLRE